MSFINWGDETPEQKAHRRKMEEQALIEHAMMRKIFEARSGTASAAAASAGSGSPFPSKVGISTAYVYRDLDGEFRIGFIDYAIGRFSKEFRTGLNSSDNWFHDSNNYSATYVIDGKGYAIVFSNNSNEHKIFFFTAGGALIETLEVTTIDLSITEINGDFVLLRDTDANIVWWFDGEIVQSDSTTFANSLSWGYNGEFNLDGFFMYQIADDDPNIFSRIYINDGTGFRIIAEYDVTETPQYSYTHRAYANSRILRVALYDTDDNKYRNLEYFDADSNSLNDYDLSTENYTTWFSDCYGTGKHIDTFLNADFYELRYCDSVRGIYTTTQHDKGASYGDFFVIGTYVSKSSYYDNIPERALICFADGSQGDDHNLRLVDYCDFIALYDVVEDLDNVYTYTDGTTKMFGRDNVQVSDSIFIPVCTDVLEDPKLIKVLTFSSNGSTYTTLLTGFDTFEYIWNSTMTGKKYIIRTATDDGLSPGKTFIFNSIGDSFKEGDWLDVDSNNLLFYGAGDILVWRSSNDADYQSYYYNASTDIGSPIAISPFGRGWTTRPYTADDQLRESRVLLQGGSSYRLYKFNDVGDDEIADGGNDMYDGGNQLYSGIAGSIPYTHTQMNSPDGLEATDSLFVKDGAVADGDSYFGGGSEYFTNCYPGLFVCVAKNINIDSFGIDGNTGVDSSGYNTNGNFPLTIGATNYTVFYKTTTGSGDAFDGESDPTINQIIIIDSTSGDAVQTVGTDTNNDNHEISELVASGANEIHYLLLSTYNKSVQLGLGTDDISDIATAYLNIVQGYNIANTLTELNANYSDITNLIGSQDTYWFSLISNSGYTEISSPFFEDVRMGPNLIAGVYYNADGFICVNLYDTDLQLLATHVTEEYEYDSLRVIGDRAYLRTNVEDGITRVWTILNPTKFAKKSFSQDEYLWVESNDYVNWN